MTAIAEQRKEHFTAEPYLAFLRTRPDEERWQLIDGVAVMRNPPTYRHQKIGANLLRLLGDGLEHTRPDLVAVYGGGVRVEGYAAFLPEPDIVVVDQAADEISYADRFYLAAEILSQPNDPEFIELKVERYAQHPHNLYTLVIARREVRVELFARVNDWQPVILRSPDELLELPEFGVNGAVRNLYRGTPLA